MKKWYDKNIAAITVISINGDYELLKNVTNYRGIAHIYEGWLMWYHPDLNEIQKTIVTEHQSLLKDIPQELIFMLNCLKSNL